MISAKYGDELQLVVSLRPPQARDPLPGKLMSLLVRWNDERQIASDLAQEHSLWMAAFWEKLRAAGAVMDIKPAIKR
jgi:hypothetical protein